MIPTKLENEMLSSDSLASSDKSFTKRLLDGLSTTPISSFSPLENRIIEIMIKIIPSLASYVMMEGYDMSNGPMTKPPELTTKMISKLVKLSLIGAIETDEQLRQLRK